MRRFDRASHEVPDESREAPEKARDQNEEKEPKSVGWAVVRYPFAQLFGPTRDEFDGDFTVDRIDCYVTGRFDQSSSSFARIDSEALQQSCHRRQILSGRLDLSLRRRFDRLQRRRIACESHLKADVAVALIGQVDMTRREPRSTLDFDFEPVSPGVAGDARRIGQFRDVDIHVEKSKEQIFLTTDDRCKRVSVGGRIGNVGMLSWVEKEQDDIMLESMVRWIKRLGVMGGVLVATAYILFCAYSLPRHVKVHVTGTEVTRKDVEGSDGRVRTQDVRYVMAADRAGEPRMFRNQDTGWGWPPYLKFDSGDVAAQANNYSVDGREDVVLITYYGFRIRVLSAFPNIISMKTVAPDYQPIPWTTIMVVLAHVVLVGVVVVFVRDFAEGREGKP